MTSLISRLVHKLLHHEPAVRVPPPTEKEEILRRKQAMMDYVAVAQARVVARISEYITEEDNNDAQRDR